MEMMNECPICFEVITQTNNCCTTPCGHAFCFKCIAKAMSNNTQCPCCRQELMEKTEEDDDDEEDDEEEDDDETIDDDDDEENNNEGSIEQIEERFIRKGFNLTDAILILMDRSSKINPKYNMEYIDNISTQFEELIEELDEETLSNNNMEKEDLLSEQMRKEEKRILAEQNNKNKNVEIFEIFIEGVSYYTDNEKNGTIYKNEGLDGITELGKFVNGIVIFNQL